MHLHKKDFFHSMVIWDILTVQFTLDLSFKHRTNFSNLYNFKLQVGSYQVTVELNFKYLSTALKKEDACDKVKQRHYN